MHYFITERQRKASQSTCYFEFQKGSFRNKFWKRDSVYLHLDLFEELDLYRPFTDALPHFDFFGNTKVTQAEYEVLKSNIVALGGNAAAAINELDKWACECFQTENIFTILGI